MAAPFHPNRRCGETEAFLFYVPGLAAFRPAHPLFRGGECLLYLYPSRADAMLRVFSARKDPSFPRPVCLRRFATLRATLRATL